VSNFGDTRKFPAMRHLVRTLHVTCKEVATKRKHESIEGSQISGESPPALPRLLRLERYRQYSEQRTSPLFPILFYTGIFLTGLYTVVGLLPYLVDSTVSSCTMDDPHFDDISDSLVRVYFDTLCNRWRLGKPPRASDISILMPKSLLTTPSEAHS
jgi:hypothetical protein